MSEEWEGGGRNGGGKGERGGRKGMEGDNMF